MAWTSNPDRARWGSSRGGRLKNGIWWDGSWGEGSIRSQAKPQEDGSELGVTDTRNGGA